MKRLNSLFILSLILTGVIIMAGSCKKEDKYELILPGTFVHFIGSASQTYQMIVNPAPVYTINLGTTDVSSSDRKVTVKISSTTAVAGTHYSIVGGSNIVTIQAGKTTASLGIQGVASFYTGLRKDTLLITLATPDITPAKFSDTIRLLLRGACLETDLSNASFSSITGTYTKTFENGSYGPYVTTLVTPANLTSTSSRATLTNIYDSGISSTVTFNYPAGGPFTATVADQATGFTVGGLPLSIRSTPATTSTYTFCTPTFTLYLDLYTSAGLYDRWVMTMAR